MRFISRKWILLSSIVFVFVIFATACGSSTDTTSDESSQGAGPPSTGDGSQETRRITIAGGESGGRYFIIGTGIAEMMKKHMPDVIANAESTGGSKENLVLVGNGENELGFTTYDLGYKAINKEGEYADKDYEIAAISPGHGSALWLVVRDESPITKLEDLNGKKVIMGPAGSATEVVGKLLLESIGITYDDINEEFLSFNDTASSLKDGLADAGFFLGGVSPRTANTAIVDLNTTTDIRVIGVEEQVIEGFIEQNPFYKRYRIPAEVAGKAPQSEKRTVGIGTSVITQPDEDPEFIYDILGMIYDNKEEFLSIHPSTEEYVEEEAIQSLPIPLHPGAEKFYKENGILD